MITAQPKKCRNCGGSIVGRSHLALSCSPECQAEHKRAYLRRYMRALRTKPEYRERKREWTRRRRAGVGDMPQKSTNPNRLPPLTRSQFKLYCKLRWHAARMTRADALAAVGAL